MIEWKDNKFNFSIDKEWFVFGLFYNAGYQSKHYNIHINVYNKKFQFTAYGYYDDIEKCKQFAEQKLGELIETKNAYCKMFGNKE